MAALAPGQAVLGSPLSVQATARIREILEGRRRGLRAVLPLAGPARGWVDVLTGAVFRGESLPLADVTGALPVALLVPEDK